MGCVVFTVWGLGSGVRVCPAGVGFRAYGNLWDVTLKASPFEIAGLGTLGLGVLVDFGLMALHWVLWIWF